MTFLEMILAPDGPGRWVILATAAIGAGAMNAVAGGGSFLTFPALVFMGVPSVAANASSTVAVFPGSFAAAWAYRRDFKAFPGIGLPAILGISLVGSVIGALLLLLTPQQTFDRVVPWLLLGATLIFAGGKRLTAWLRGHWRIGPVTLLVLQFIIAIYGGYFGGAIGILMLAAYGLFGLEDLNAMNAMKTLLAGSLNGMAVICFIIAGKVWWTESLVMMAGALAGGYLGARIARKASPLVVRTIIITIGLGMSAVFFSRV